MRLPSSVVIVFIAAAAAAASACGPKAGPPPTHASPSTPVDPPAPQSPPLPAFDARSTHAFAVKERCSQGPFEFEVKALGAKGAERLVIEMCAPRIVGGQIEVESPWVRAAGSFGFRDPDNARCVAQPGEAVRAVSSPTASPAPGKTARKGAQGSSPPSAAPSMAKAVEVPWSGKHGCTVTDVFDEMWHGRGLTEMPAGTPIRVRIWFTVPNDLEGVYFVVRQLGLAKGVSEADLTEYARRYRAYLEARRAWSDRLPSCGPHGLPTAGTCVHRDTPPAPSSPPPLRRAEKQPPRPSANAYWVPGYWHWDADHWGWLAGFWRVPDTDVARDLTARAPAPPPAPRQELPEARPAAAAVWVVGHWMWTPQGWAWVDGAWRLAPFPGARWQPPSWRVVRSGVVFVPGAWVR
jgi:hypothetical protein